jgi:Tol biopolymer transport system component/tRNA A-37 threonylcarbamoyl transferase component Bud32
MIRNGLSHYRIIEELGYGGMGVVYKAEDTKLQRIVALKFLHPGMIRDSEAKARFTREAKAAASISHPNICTVYDIDESEGASFISMEHIEGQSLKEMLEAGPLDIKTAVDIATQVACGLAEAHQKGIVHRDIKPANIMIDSSNRIRIMDFGLAKLKDLTALTKDSLTLGTVSYMSPEQGEGAEIGPPSDIWSLGVVIYQMITGTLPFQGEYDVAVMYSIINEKPVRLSALRDDVPQKLEQIVEKALSKNPGSRYITGGEILDDLQRLKQRIDLSEETDTGAWRFGGIRWRKIWPLAAVAAVVLAAVFIILQRTSRIEVRSPVLPGQPFQVTGSDAWESEPCISPDGGRIAYSSNISGNRDIYITDARGGNSLRLTSDPAPDYHPVWFPGGSSLAFVSERGGTPAIWKIGQFGGGATLLLKNAIYPAISPSGDKIAFSRPEKKGILHVGVARLTDPPEIKMLTGDDNGLWGHRCPAWSPDGKLICYSTHHGLWIIPSSGGAVRRLTTGGRLDSDPAWSSDGKRIYFSSYRNGPLALWCVSAEGENLQRLTTGTGRETEPSVSKDGSKFVYTAQRIRRDLIIRNTGSGSESMIKGLRNDYMAALAPDGSSVVFASERAGSRTELWIQALEDGVPSGEPRRLTDHPGDSSHPAFSPDGKWIAYYRIYNELRDIWIIPSGGGQAEPFTSHPAPDIHPAWSPDGSKIAFSSERDGQANIWLAPVSNGKRAGPVVLLTSGDLGCLAPWWSPDGHLISFIGMKGGESDVWVVSPDGEGDVRQVTSGANARRVRWDPATGEILASLTWGGNRYLLHRLSPENGSSHEVDCPVIFGSITAPATFDISLDGRFLLYCQEESSGQIWMIEAEKGVY